LKDGNVCIQQKQRRVVKIFITLVAYTGIAAVFDIKTWRIPNIYAICGMMAGILKAVLFQGKHGLCYSIIGMMLPVAVLFVLFLLKAIGGGDIKLFSAIGSFIGADIGFIMLYSFIAGGILSFIYLISSIVKSNTNRISNSKLISAGENNLNLPFKGKIHFSPAILIGTIWYAVLKHL